MERLSTALLGIGMAGAALPLGSAWAASSQIHHKATVSGVFKGPAVNMQWGAVQVTITVVNGKITKVKATAPHHTSRSKLINSVALPLLKKEVLKAQSAKISTLSGATLTSNAYILSLQSALTAAHL